MTSTEALAGDRRGEGVKTGKIKIGMNLKVFDVAKSILKVFFNSFIFGAISSVNSTQKASPGLQCQILKLEYEGGFRLQLPGSFPDKGYSRNYFRK